MVFSSSDTKTKFYETSAIIAAPIEIKTKSKCQIVLVKVIKPLTVRGFLIRPYSPALGEGHNHMFFGLNLTPLQFPHKSILLVLRLNP